MAFLRSTRKAFQHDDRFTDLFPLLAQIGEHLQYVHDGRISQAPPRTACARGIYPMLDKTPEGLSVRPAGLGRFPAAELSTAVPAQAMGSQLVLAGLQSTSTVCALHVKVR